MRFTRLFRMVFTKSLKDKKKKNFVFSNWHVFRLFLQQFSLSVFFFQFYVVVVIFDYKIFINFMDYKRILFVFNFLTSFNSLPKSPQYPQANSRKAKWNMKKKTIFGNVAWLTGHPIAFAFSSAIASACFWWWCWRWRFISSVLLRWHCRCG